MPPKPPSNRGPVLALLTEGSYRWLLLSNLFSSVGVELRVMAQSWLILELGGTQYDVGAATGYRVVPALVLSLAAGVLIDRVGGRTMLVWDRIIQIAMAALMAALVMAGPIAVWHVIVLSVLTGAVMGISVPARNTLVPQIVSREQLQSANALSTLVVSAAGVVGPMSGGLLIAAYGLGSPWAALAGFYLLSIFALFWVPEVRPERGAREPALRSLAEGIRYVRSDPLISRVMLLAFSVFAPMTIFPALPIYARERFGLGGTGFGTMMTALAVGQGASAIYVTARGGWERKSVPILTSSTVYAIGMAVLGFSHSYPLMLGILFCLGAAIPPWVTSVSTILQTHAEEGMLGRVMAVFATSFQVAIVGWLVGGWLGERIGNEWMMLWMGVAYLVANWGIFATSKELRAI